jgi:PAS domain S-box-containing protein
LTSKESKVLDINRLNKIRVKVKISALAALIVGLIIIGGLFLFPTVGGAPKFVELIWGVLLLLFALVAFNFSNELKTDQADIERSFELVKRLRADVNVGGFVQAARLSDELKTVSEGIAEARKRERSIIDNAVDVICIIDVDSRFLSVSPSSEKVFGYRPLELLGHSLAEFLEGGETDQSLSTVLGAQASIDKIVFENRFRHRNGGLVDLSWSAHWSASDNGLFCVAHDITKRKQAELQVQESEQRLRTTMEAMPTAIACTNPLGLVEYANHNLEELVNKKAIDFMGRSLSEFFGSESAKVHSFLTQGGGKNLETFIQKTSGDRIDLELSVTRFLMKGQNKLLVTISDISHVKQVQVMKQQFVSMVNHDLRTPLSSLSAMISMFKQGSYGELNPVGVKTCDLADAELDRLLRLVGELLDLDRFETGEFPLNLALVSAQDVFEASVASVNAFAELKGIKIQHADYEEVACYCDRTRTIQIIVNLLSNAIKFSPEDSVINLELIEESKFIKFLVNDRGPGIPAGKEELIFDRFKQANPENEVERSGSGLGLAISKAIVEAHGGSIGCSNLESGGSSFWFTFPKN